MTLEELIQDLSSIRQLRGGDCSVKICPPSDDDSTLEIIHLRADTTTGLTIVEIIVA